MAVRPEQRKGVEGMASAEGQLEIQINLAFKSQRLADYFRPFDMQHIVLDTLFAPLLGTFL